MADEDESGIEVTDTPLPGADPYELRHSLAAHTVWTPDRPPGKGEEYCTSQALRKVVITVVQLICGACQHSGVHAQILAPGSGMQKWCADCPRCTREAKRPKL